MLIKRNTPSIALSNQENKCRPSAWNEVRTNLGGLIGGDTKYDRKEYARRLVASQEMFHIILTHGKGKEPRMVGEDLVFIEKEVV